MDDLLELPFSATYALIALNVAVSIPGFWALSRDRHADHFLFIPYRVARGKNLLGAVLSHFAHGDFGHLALNMLVLYLFGPRVEQTLGVVPYLLLYAASGLGGTLAIFAIRYRNDRHSALGASGAIAGVVFATVVIAPTATFMFIFVPIPIPAPIFAVLYLVASSLMMKRGDHVAHEAHIGGALTGLGLAGLFYEHGFDRLVREVTRLIG